MVKGVNLLAPTTQQWNPPKCLPFVSDLLLEVARWCFDTIGPKHSRTQLIAHQRIYEEPLKNLNHSVGLDEGTLNAYVLDGFPFEKQKVLNRFKKAKV